ncbi:MAG TPA: hypothetical protein VGE90_11335 [Chitinophaga sp.]
MKTKGLMIAALFISGAAFAQTASVKQEQQVKVSSNTQVNAAENKQPANVQANAAAQQESAVTADPSAAVAAKSAVKSNAKSSVKAVKATTDQLQDQTVQTSKVAVQQVNNVTATAARSTVHVNSAVNNSLKIKAAPVKVNALSSGAIGLKGL